MSMFAFVKGREALLTPILFSFILTLTQPFERLYGAENDLLDQIIKLDEQRREQMKTCRFEFNRSFRIGAKNMYEMKGNSWEQENGKTLSLDHEVVYPKGFQPGDPVNERISVHYFDGERFFSFRAPTDKYPAPDRLDSKDFYLTGEYFADLSRRSKKRAFERGRFPLPVLPIPGYDYDVPLRDFFKHNSPTKITERTLESGDRVVHCELSGDFPNSGDYMNYKNWELAVDFNLSKGGALIGYEGTIYLQPKLPTVHMSCVVLNLEQYGKGIWLQQEFETRAYDQFEQNKEEESVYHTAVTSVSLNEKLPTPVDSFDFPAGSVVYESLDDRTGKTIYHIWGKSKPEKTFEDKQALLKEIGVAE